MNIQHTQIVCSKSTAFDIRLFDKAFKVSIPNVSTSDNKLRIITLEIVLSS